MKKFKYKIEYFSGYGDLENWLNDQGEKGWELVSAKYYHPDRDIEGIYVFKRELEQDNK